MRKKILESQYLLALMVGVYPITFYLSNNWFVFEASRSLVIFGAFSLTIFLALSAYYLVLSRLVRGLVNHSAPIITQRLFVFTSIVVMAYLLRDPFSGIVANPFYLSLIVVVIALILGWFAPKIQLFQLNISLMFLCLLSLGSGFYSIVTTKPANTLASKVEDKSVQAIYAQAKFVKKPNVYYVVPDGYPNKEALKNIFDLDNTKAYQKLESLGFRIYPLSFSNYHSTLSSIRSSFGMQHHYYRGSIGNFELLNSREFIVSDQNPVVSLFKQNGYQINYVHEDEYMFSRGCFVDLCSPSVFWGDYIDILVPKQLQSLSVVASAIDLAGELVTRLSGSMRRVLGHIDRMSADDQRHFTYIHLKYPSHSRTYRQSGDDLASFRINFHKKIQVANDRIFTVVEHILSRDPNGLVIINADHGAWGFGSTRQDAVDESMPDNLIALDQLGVLVAIRWPEDAPKYDQDIRTNVNLFRYVFSYLSESEDILATKVPDHGFLEKGRGKERIVVKAVDDGEVLEHMVEMGPVE